MELFMCSVKQREGYGEVHYILNKLHDFYFNLILLKKRRFVGYLNIYS